MASSRVVHGIVDILLRPCNMLRSNAIPGTISAGTRSFAGERNSGDFTDCVAGLPGASFTRLRTQSENDRLIASALPADDRSV